MSVICIVMPSSRPGWRIRRKNRHGNPGGDLVEIAEIAASPDGRIAP